MRTYNHTPRWNTITHTALTIGNSEGHMPEEINVVITQIHASVELLGVKVENWGAEVIARVTNIVSQPNDTSNIAYAAGMAYVKKFDGSDNTQEAISRTKMECVTKSVEADNSWYVHVKVFKKR